MRILLIAISVCLQQDPAATLAGSARRTVEADRKAALEHFGSRSRESAPHWVAARFLERSEREWRLRYDRLTTKEGAFAGRAEGGAFFAFNGKRLEVGAGKLEKDVLDPATPELDAILARYYGSREGDGLVLDLLASAYEHTKGKSEASEVFRHFALGPLSGIGDRGAGAASRLGLASMDGRWGSPEQLRHARIIAALAKPDAVDPSIEPAAKSSPTFGGRYACLLLQIQKACAGTLGFEAAHRAILEFPESGGPRGARDHLRALAASLKEAVYCKDCKNGKLPCAGCKGKGKRDITCDPCGGTGRVRPGGIIGKSDATAKCRNCDGLRGFKGVGCTECGKTGQVDCAGCQGRPWRDRSCSAPGCVGGMVPCGTCKAGTAARADCGLCEGKGRVRPIGAATEGEVSVKCRGCDGKGKLDAKCIPCKQIGRVRCEACKDKAPGKGFAAKASDIYTPEACRDCGGAGFPLRNVALACSKCFGLGIRAKPAADPSKLLD